MLGLIAGYQGGHLDSAITIICDALLTVPGIALLIVIASNVEQMTVEIMAVTVAALAWMFPTRMISAPGSVDPGALVCRSRPRGTASGRPG